MNDSEESNITEPTTSTTDHSKVKGSHNIFLPIRIPKFFFTFNLQFYIYFCPSFA